MSEIRESEEMDALREVKLRYESSGYEFLVEPPVDAVPSFLEGVRPDAIARKGSEGVIIEVKRTAESAENSALVRFLANEVPKHKGWNFELVLVNPHSTDKIPTRDEIVKELKLVRNLVHQGNSKVAILFAWGLLEASVKIVLPNDTIDRSKRYLPRTIVESLVSEGLVDVRRGEMLLEAGRIRTLLAHGMVSKPVPLQVMENLIEVISELLSDNTLNGFHE